MIRTAKVALDWGALQIEEAGDGDPLLLISGLNGLAQPWRGIVPALAAQFRVITHDHRGLGGSDRWDGAYSVNQIAADVLGLMDALGIARTHIVGHSLGGAVAQALAADHPSRVAGVAIYASWPGPDAYFTRVMAMRQDVLTGLGVESFLRTGPIGIYPPHWITMHNAALAAALPALLAAFPGVDVMLRRMQACLVHDRRASLARITAPCLVLGLQDVLREHWDGRVRADEIGVSPSLSPKFPNVSVGYGSLVPETLDGLLAPGRHLACDATSHSFMREIPQCWLTGQAAGAAAALAANAGVPPRAVPLTDLQRVLRAQGAFLQDQAPAKAAE